MANQDLLCIVCEQRAGIFAPRNGRGFCAGCFLSWHEQMTGFENYIQRYFPPVEKKKSANSKGPRQSLEDRAARLKEGRCPIHGIPMTQTGWPRRENGAVYFLVGCGRRGCGIEAKEFTSQGPWELMPEFQYLINK